MPPTLTKGKRKARAGRTNGAVGKGGHAARSPTAGKGVESLGPGVPGATAQAAVKFDRASPQYQAAMRLYNEMRKVVGLADIPTWTALPAASRQRFINLTLAHSNIV